MTHSITLTAGQWYIVEQYVRSDVRIFDEEKLRSDLSDVVRRALYISAKLAFDYYRTIEAVCNAIPGDDDVLVTVDHPGIEIARARIRDIYPMGDLTTWDEVLAYARSGSAFGMLLSEDESAGAEPEHERLVALIAEANARRERWRATTRPIYQALVADWDCRG